MLHNTIFRLLLNAVLKIERVSIRCSYQPSRQYSRSERLWPTQVDHRLEILSSLSSQIPRKRINAATSSEEFLQRDIKIIFFIKILIN